MTDTGSRGAVARPRTRSILSVLLLAVLVAGLVGYKAYGGFARMAELRTTGSLRLNAVALHRPAGSELAATASQTLGYLKIVWPALVFGILISAGVHASLSPQQLSALFGRGPVGSQFVAAAAGAPLMLCSCCVAPIFAAVYQRTHRLSPSLALTLAAPSLNPAALALTFMLFPVEVAGARLVLALVLVLLVSALAAGAAGAVPAAIIGAGDAGEPADDARQFLASFVRSLKHITLRTVPWILLGIWLSMLIANRMPVEAFASAGHKVVIIAVVALGALLLTLPTLFEIPLAFSLISVGAPAGAALAVLVAGPAINLASLLVIARYSHWKVSVLLASLVWTATVAAGLLIG